jgi:P-type Ca2+ transporter type 2C
MMELAAFSVFNLQFSLETADEERTLFSSEHLEYPMLTKTTALSIVTIVVATELGVLQRILGTVGLSLEQWGVCVAVACAIVVVAEVKRLLKIRTVELSASRVAPAAA